jgi:Fe-S-cluster-containing hydrogenase component 2
MLRLTVRKVQCTGCRLCESVCAAGHAPAFSLREARLRIAQETITEPSFTVSVCRQCAVCPPLAACPTGALTRDARTGVLHLDPARCPTGCRLCAEACHLGAFHEGGPGLILCDLCGGDPECVRACYTEALFLSEYQLSGRARARPALERSPR